MCKYVSLFKYGLAAILLKIFSACPNFYRFLGNRIGTKKRMQLGIPDYYGKRAKEHLDFYRKYDMIKDGDEILEIGTGWVHFESVVIRLFYNVKTTLFDVWDNRQLDALKQYTVQLEGLLYQEMDLNGYQKQRIRQLTEIISNAKSFESLYQSLNFTYLVNQKGSLDHLNDESFQLVYSHNVLEHVDREAVLQLIKEYYRVLKPGGYSYHDIDISDHLISFTGTYNLPDKYYLRFLNPTWKRFFENKVQYFNRVQSSEWIDFFKQTGFELIEKHSVASNINPKTISKSYRHFTKADLDCKRLKLIHQKPVH